MLLKDSILHRFPSISLIAIPRILFSTLNWKESPMDAKTLQTLQDVHVAAWNEKDSVKRTELLQTIYAEDMQLYDTHFILQGINAVSDFIGKLINEDPHYFFSAAQPIEATQNGVRLYGTIGTAQGTLSSMDFMVIEDDKVHHLYVFMG